MVQKAQTRTSQGARTSRGIVALATAVAAVLIAAETVVAQGPGWQLGEVDDCQRKDIASDPQQHAFWKDAAPIALYVHVLLNTTDHDPSADISSHDAGGRPKRRVQLQRTMLTGPQLWQMDQEAPAFDPTYQLVRTGTLLWPTVLAY